MIELDLMEYSTDALAQAAYVTDGGYGSDICNGGIASANSELSPASNAFDNNEATRWYGTGGYPYYLKYDLGAGVTKRVSKLRIKPHYDSPDSCVKSFTFSGSNDDSSYTTLYTGVNSADSNWQEFTFNNPIAYRYYKIIWTDGYVGNDAAVWEVEMLEWVLQSYSESTIKTQGSYALKAVAAQTDSLNKTLTRTLASNIDLSGVNTLKFDMRATRTGANVKLGLHDTGGTTTELTPNITSADTYQTVEGDISGVADADKNAIDQIIFTQVNADSATTWYVDNLFAPVAYSKIFTDGLIISDNISKGAGKPFAEVMGISDVFTRGIGKPFIDGITVNDNYSRKMTWNKKFTEMIALTEVSARNIYLYFTDAITLADTYVKSWTISRVFTDTISFSDTLSPVFKWLRATHLVTAWQKANKSLSTWGKQVKSGGIWTRKIW